jgi:hypothetical protein
MSFRVALGRCDCSKPDNVVIAELCTKVRQKIDHLRSLSPQQLAELSEESQDSWVAGKRANITVHGRPYDTGVMMIVVQGFVSTFRRPTYIGTDGIGHIVAEGFLINNEGVIQPAPDEALWEFR